MSTRYNIPAKKDVNRFDLQLNILTNIINKTPFSYVKMSERSTDGHEFVKFRTYRWQNLSFSSKIGQKNPKDGQKLAISQKRLLQLFSKSISSGSVITLSMENGNISNGSCPFSGLNRIYPVRFLCIPCCGREIRRKYFESTTGGAT